MSLLGLAQSSLTGFVCFLAALSALFADEPRLGKFGGAVDFRKTPLRVEALADYGRLPLTVECWVKLPSDQTRRDNVLVSHLPESAPGHWELYTTPLDGHFTVRIGGETPTRIPSFIRITDDRWHFLSVRFDENRTTVTIDGKQVASRPVSLAQSKQPTEGELFVGTEYADPKSTAVSSYLDDLRLSAGVRDPAHVPEKPFAMDRETIGLWHFDESTGNAHLDASPNGNQLAYSPGIDSAWTPRSATRPDAPDWEKETDDHWQDGRFNLMNKGPFMGGSLTVPGSKIHPQPRYVAKGLAVKHGNTSTLFDKSRLQLAGGWTDGFLHYGERRFGLIEHPTIEGQVQFSMNAGSDWEIEGESIPLPPSQWSPLPESWGRYAGFYRHGDQVIHRYAIGDATILDSPGSTKVGDKTLITRTVEVGPAEKELILNVVSGSGALSADGHSDYESPDFSIFRVEWKGSLIGFVFLPHKKDKDLYRYFHWSKVFGGEGAKLRIHIRPHKEPVRLRLAYFTGTEADWKSIREAATKLTGPENLKVLTDGGPALWNSEITTAGVLGKSETPFAVDTLTLPTENPFKSIFYVTGVGFLSKTRLAICTIYGDVWLVDGISEDLSKLRWKRFASGLYQPMGLVIKDGEILVLERGQVTRLKDLNHDDEADYFENYYHGWQETGAGHAYDTALKLAPDGSLYFFKGQTGGTDCAESGCLVRIAPDAKSHEVFATGFRHPIGLGMSPDGIVTGADQQGNWMPATRIDHYKQGGFYGDMRTHHRDTPPTIYDPPLCWLPRDVDNSAGGQVWVPEGHWGALGGKPLHLSWGRCRVFELLHEEIAGEWQGGVVPLASELFSSGPITGVFSPFDGHLYVVGLHGWQTAGKADGCLQRVRYTGGNLNLPVELHAYEDGVEITFSDALDSASATNPENYIVERWNYRWSEAYGSDHWSVENPAEQRHDPVTVESITIAKDGKTVFLEIKDMQPVMQMKLAYVLKSAKGESFSNTIHHTVNQMGKH